ncbi:MAG: ComEA family DNA-binding protein [Chloroflexi bacterium]|nr:ComEA family DNA-binding protein [Chloroflexota bacterium]
MCQQKRPSHATVRGNGRIQKGEVVIDRNKFIHIVISIFIGATIGIGAVTLLRQTRPAPIVINPPEPTSPPLPTATPGSIQVYINGAVVMPDIYELPPNSNVEAAIKAAGGFTEKANTAVVNLAQPLSHGFQVYIPTTDTTAEPIAIINKPDDTPAQTLTNNDPDTNGFVNINSADLDELDTLPGIGPSTAQNILDHRDANGPFQTIEALLDVSGIGEAKFAQIKDLITVEGEK